MSTRRWELAAVVVAVVASVTGALAGDDHDRERKSSTAGLTKGMLTERGEKQSATDDRSPYRKDSWAMSLESAYLFQDIPAPLFLLAGHVYTNPNTYQLATQILSVRYQFTDPAGPWLLRGTLEGSAAVVGSAIVRGPESYFVGFALGLRYYFIQPGARLVPYIELRGGPGQVDAQGDRDRNRRSQQEDLAFTYLLGLGVRYDAGRHWSYTLSAIDQHLSNGYLATPNFGFDSVGFNLGVIRRF